MNWFDLYHKDYGSVMQAVARELKALTLTELLLAVERAGLRQKNSDTPRATLSDRTLLCV